VNKIIKAFLDWIYPPKCPVCAKILSADNKYICPECFEKLKLIGEDACPSCGAALGLSGICFNCENDFSFESNIAFFEYNETMREIIHSIKYGKKAHKMIALASIMAEHAGDKLDNYSDFDIIIPVPLHKKRFRKRGFNQADIIGEKIAELTGVKLEADICERKVDTAPQSLTGSGSRRQNVEGIFDLKANIDVKGKKIILADDIFTSGSTLNSLSNMLKELGAETVVCVTLCISAR